MPKNDEFLDLITRYLDNPSNKTLQVEITAFRSASPENEAYFISIEKLWKQSARAAVLEEVNIIDSTNKLKLSLRQYSPKRLSTMGWIRRVAAAVSILSISYWAYFQNNKPNYVVLTTAKNQVDSVKLVDGSTIILAENSELRYPDKFEGTTREISLNKGEAFFKVAKDKYHPFRVVVNESEVVVLGTSFNIKLMANRINLGVKTGRVLFSPYKSAVGSVLKAGQAISYDINKKELSTKTAENEDSWLTKELVFVDTPLDEVCAQLTDYYQIEIRLQDNKQHSKKLNAKFTNQPLDEVLLVLKEAYNFKINKEHNRINLITPKKIN